MDLPTVEQLHAFMGAINAGRVEFGLEPIERLEFDQCTPSSNQNCLSAHHMTTPIAKSLGCESRTWFTTIEIDDETAVLRLARALGTAARWPARWPAILIPDVLSCVTNPFDDLPKRARWDSRIDHGDPSVIAFRERVVEAGLIAD